MAIAAGLTIPLNSNIDKQMLDVLSKMTDLMTDSQKKQIDNAKKESDHDEAMLDAYNTLNKEYTKQYNEGKITGNEYNLRLKETIATLNILKDNGIAQLELEKKKEEKDDLIKLLENKLKFVPNFMKGTISKQIELLKIEQKYAESQEQLEKLLSNPDSRLSPIEKQLLKLQLKVAKVYDKWLVKFPFFKRLTDGIKGIAKGITNMVKNNWFTMLMGLLMLVMFDPEGKFLLSILDFIINMALMLIDVIIQYIPKIIDVIIKLIPKLIKVAIYIITDVLPNVLRKIVGALFPAVGKMFTKWSISLKKDYPIISWIFSKLGTAFSKNGVFYKFAMWIIKIFQILGKSGIGSAFKAVGAGIASIASSAKDWLANTSVGKAVGGAVSTVKEYGGKAIDWVMQKLSSFATWLGKFLDVLKDIGQWFSIISSDPINFFLGRLNKTAMKKYLEYQSAVEGKVSFTRGEKEKLYKEGKTTEEVAVMEGTASLKQFEEYLKQQDKDGKQFISLSGEMVKILDKIEKKGGGQKPQTNATVIKMFDDRRSGK